uniref:Ras-related protein Rab-18 n=1 Tax=Macrostomum lignano TaxID=282301 RepID=A0A1I8F4T4_9PLAT
AVNRTPERVFKVVFIGDSGRRQELSDSPTMPGRLQVNFRSHHRYRLPGEGHGTGGVRFRSITKQYFRKADGIVIVYDVTSAQSYLHLREWLDCIQEGDGDGAVKLLLGNKVDLLAPTKKAATDEVAGSARAVEAQAAQRLADECSDSGKAAPALFFEVSAKSGKSVGEAFVKFA